MTILRRELESLLGALRFFTRVPVPAWVGHSPAALNRSARYFPAVGLGVGGCAAAVYTGALVLWPQPVAVLLAIACGLWLTGAFHEDGLADATDGLGGGWTRARILEIMRDSRVGSFGVVALWLGLTGKFVLLSGLPPGAVAPALIAGHALSRLCATVPLATMRYVREEADAKAKPLATGLSAPALAVAAAFGGAGLLLLPPAVALAGAAAAALVTLWFLRRLAHWLGGYTGDCLGATQQLSELAFYLGILGAWPTHPLHCGSSI